VYSRSYLSWHYRSKYQELIDFSNHAFYEGDLQLAPNIWRSPSIPPIKWVVCNDGCWIDRNNIPEAAMVVDELKNILTSNSNMKCEIYEDYRFG
jgi:superfamily I DNA and/or RNA helicase